MSQPFVFAPVIHPDPMPPAERAALLADLGFGGVFTDHAVTLRHTAKDGWHEAQIGPRRPITLDPAATALHYGQEIFEGLKAYRAPDGHALLFRPEANARRFAQSARRLAMPPLPEDFFIQAVETLVRADGGWIPGGDGSLYIRPFMIGVGAALGVRASTEFLFMVFAAPVAGYFSGATKGLSVWVSDDLTRAARGGTGAVKCGGNYAASLAAQAEATEQGCDQAIFLDAAEGRWIEELGGMNVFFVFEDGSLLTPPLDGTILPGITRDSVIALARQEGHEVREASYSLDQWRVDAQSGRVVEAFACGTAAVLTAIGQVRAKSGDFTIGDGGFGPRTAALRTALTNVQRGLTSDLHGWTRKVDLAPDRV